MQRELRRVLDSAVRYDDFLTALIHAEHEADAARRGRDSERARALARRVTARRRELDRTHDELRRAQVALKELEQDR